MAKKRRLLLAFGALTVLVLFAVLALISGGSSALGPLPNPNGYEDFIKAGEGVAGNVADWPTLSRDELRQLISTNAETLRLLRLGLTRQCSVPTDNAMTNLSGRANDMMQLKRLAQLLAAEGRVHELEGDASGAALVYTEIVRFGNETSRGGFLINRLVGIACEAIGCNPLAKLVPQLKCNEARPVIASLEQVDKSRVTWDEVRRNENRFSRYHLRKAFNPITWVVGRWQLWRIVRESEIRHKRIIARERLLAAELAVRCYQSEKSHVPIGLEELVPIYLSAVPQDPFSGRPLIYRARGTNWLLYSVGVDQVDDGGKPANRGLSAKGDLFFDSVW